MIETVAVAGGNGKIGGAILEHLGEHGYGTVNLSRGERDEDVADEYRRTDLLDAGDVYGSLARSDADAVIHMATIPGPENDPGHVTFESNAMSSYHVLEAASELGLESVVLPSSINVVGAAYQEAPTEVEYLPMDENHPLTPRDPYALGKRATEAVADGFGRLPDAPTVSSLRYPWVGRTDEIRERYVERDRTLDGLTADSGAGKTLFSYLHVRDAASIARLAMESDHDGHEPFWAVAADTSAAVDSATLAAEFYPDAELRTELSDRESLISIDRAREVLGWEPERSWRDV